MSMRTLCAGLVLTGLLLSNGCCWRRACCRPCCSSCCSSPCTSCYPPAVDAPPAPLMPMPAPASTSPSKPTGLGLLR